MRMKKSLAKSLASYYDSVEPRQLAIDPLIKTPTDHATGSRKARQTTSGRLLLTENSVTVLAKDVVMDINVKGVPQEKDAGDDESRHTHLQRKQTLRAKKELTPVLAGEMNSKLIGDEQRDTAPTSSPEASRQRDEGKRHQMHHPRITRSALKKYRNLDALAKSVSWNDDNMQDLEMQKSRSGLRKSVSGKEEISVTSESEPSSRRLRSPIASPKERTVSDVLGVLRTMRAMSLAESYSLAEDDKNLLIKDAASPPVEMTNKGPGVCEPMAVTKATERKGFLRKVGRVFSRRKIPSASVAAQSQAQPASAGRKDRHKPRDGNRVSLYRKADSKKKNVPMPHRLAAGGQPGSKRSGSGGKPYSVILPIEGMGSLSEQCEILNPTAEEKIQGAETDICGPPSMTSYDDYDQWRDTTRAKQTPRAPAPFERLSPPPLEHPTNHPFLIRHGANRSAGQTRTFTTSLIPTLPALLEESLCQNTYKQGAGGNHNDSLEPLRLTPATGRDLGVCPAGRCACVYTVPTEDVADQAWHAGEIDSEGSKGRSAGISMSDSSSDILATSSSMESASTQTDSLCADIFHPQHQTQTKALSFIHSISEIGAGDSVSTIEALLNGVSSTLTGSEISSVATRKMTTNGWFW